MDARVHKLRDNWPGMPGADLLAFAGFTFDATGHALRDAGGCEIALTPAEFALLDTFVRNPGRVLTRDQLLVEVAGRDSESYDRSVDVLVGRLRRKIERDPKAPELIVTLPRVGYKFAARPQVVAAADVAATAAEPIAHVLAQAAPPRPDPRPAAPMERRQVTIMSCEFVGLAALSAGLDPEDLRAVVGSRHRCCADVIAKFGGVIAKLTGDGVLAYFGYPQAHEHDAERAVRAGLAATEALAQLDPTEPGLAGKISARIGIATGAVVVGDLADAGSSQDCAMIGEPFALAAHLQSRASAGAVLIAPGTRRLVGGLFDYRELGPVPLEGFAAPVAAWQVVGALAAESRFSALHNAGTSFLGREGEIELLARCWSQARSGKGRVVVVSGEPGIGKSRLCATLAERTAAEPRAASSWQCSPHHGDSTLHPIIEQLERAARLAREDTAEQKSSRVAALLRASNPDETALLSGLLGLPTHDHAPELSPQRRKHMTLEALLSHLAGSAPTLMLFEDAHWADPTSLEFLTLLVDRVQHLPVLLLITARPEFSTPWAAEAHIAAVTLNRLSKVAAAALVVQVAGRRLPDPVLDEILVRADRVPLFVEELTKAVIDGGSLMNTIPATLQDALTARLDRLAHGKEVAQIGAAIGREFSHATLSAVLPGDARDLGPALDELVRSELVFRRGMPPDAVYTFKHALVRDAAYNSMARAQRQACHARIATALMRDEPDIAAAQPELLAQHHQQAAQHEAALRLWSQAGDLAARRSAAREAASHYRSAIALLPHLLDQQQRLRFEVELCMKLANAVIQFEGFTSIKIHDLYARAQAISLDLGQTDEYVEACLAGVTSYFVPSRFNEGMAVLAKMDTDLLMRTGPAARIRVDFLKGLGNYHLGNFDEAWRIVAQAITRDDSEPCTQVHPVFGGDPAIALRSYGNLLRISQGYLEQAATLADQAVRIGEERNHAFSLAWAKSAQARTKLVLGRYAEAEDIATQAIDLCKRHGFEARGAYYSLWRGIARLALGDTNTGLPEIQEAVARWISVGGGLAIPAVQAAAQSLISAGLHADAEEFLLIGERDENGARVVAAEVLRLRGNLLAAGGRPQEAQAKLRQALAVAQQQGARLFALRAATDLAKLLNEQGNDGEPAAVLRSLYGSFTEGLDAPDLERAAAVLATVTSG